MGNAVCFCYEELGRKAHYHLSVSQLNEDSKDISGLDSLTCRKSTIHLLLDFSSVSISRLCKTAVYFLQPRELRIPWEISAVNMGDKLSDPY